MDGGDVTLRDNGDILVDGEPVGFLGWHNNTLVDISVDENRRGEGIATEAVGLMLDRIREDGYEYVKTTTVVSPAMEVVLRRNGFEQVVVEDQVSVPDTVEEELDEPPTRERIEWVYEF